MNENALFVAFLTATGIVLTTLILTVYAHNVKVNMAIVQSADPIAAACAYGGNSQACLVIAARKP